jgi:hypothetical protein
MQKISALVAVVELLLEYHPKALRILLGECVPTLMELAEIVRSASEAPDGGYGAAGLPHSKQLTDLVRGEGMQRVIDDVGGWSQLAEAVQFYRKAFPTTWAIFVDHVLSIVPGGVSRIEEQSQLARIAQKYGVRPATVCEKRKIVPEAIARYAEMAPWGELRLLNETSPTAADVEQAKQDIVHAGNDQIFLPFQE